MALRQAEAPMAGLDPTTEKSLQISGRTRTPLCYVFSSQTLSMNDAVFSSVDETLLLPPIHIKVTSSFQATKSDARLDPAREVVWRSQGCWLSTAPPKSEPTPINFAGAPVACLARGNYVPIIHRSLSGKPRGNFQQTRPLQAADRRPKKRRGSRPALYALSYCARFCLAGKPVPPNSATPVQPLETVGTCDNSRARGACRLRSTVSNYGGSSPAEATAAGHLSALLQFSGSVMAQELPFSSAGRGCAQPSVRPLREFR
ncbi:hypothetical protein PoB_007486400, partial [Plakobranchus ocellatus]